MRLRKMRTMRVRLIIHRFRLWRFRRRYGYPRKRRGAKSSSQISLVPVRSLPPRQEWYFPETPEEYPVVGGELLILHRPPPEHLQKLPPLPPATEGVEYGVTRTVDLDGQPGDPILINHLLYEPPQEPTRYKPTILRRLCRKLYQARTLLRNPLADPRFPHLPLGMNNRIRQTRDPLCDKLHRLDRWLYFTFIRRKKKSLPAARSQGRVAAPNLLGRKAKYSVPARFCPKVRPTKKFDPSPAVDHWGCPYGGEFQVFHETEEERGDRVARCLAEGSWRRASDKIFNLEGSRQQLKNPRIGKAPPLSKRQLGVPLKVKQARAKRDQREIFRVKPRKPIPDIDPKDLPLPKDNERPIQWDRVFLANKTPVRFPAGDDIELQVFMLRVPSHSSLVEKILEDVSRQKPQSTTSTPAAFLGDSQVELDARLKETGAHTPHIEPDSDDIYGVSDREVRRRRAKKDVRPLQQPLQGADMDQAENISGSVFASHQHSRPGLPNFEEIEPSKQSRTAQEESQPLVARVPQVYLEHAEIPNQIALATCKDSRPTTATASRKQRTGPFQPYREREAYRRHFHPDASHLSTTDKLNDEDDEEFRIFKAEAIAAENSTVYKQRYEGEAEERRIKGFERIAQQNSEGFARFYQPSPFASASPGRIAIWNDAELALDGKKRISPNCATVGEQQETKDVVDFTTLKFDMQGERPAEPDIRSRRPPDSATCVAEHPSSLTNQAPEGRTIDRPKDTRPEALGSTNLMFERTSSPVNQAPEDTGRSPNEEEKNNAQMLEDCARQLFNLEQTILQRCPGLGHSQSNLDQLSPDDTPSREENIDAPILKLERSTEANRRFLEPQFKQTDLKSYPGLDPAPRREGMPEKVHRRGVEGIFPYDPSSRRIDGTPIDPLQLDPEVWPERGPAGFPFPQESKCSRDPLVQTIEKTAAISNRGGLGHFLPGTGRREENNTTLANRPVQEERLDNSVQKGFLDRVDKRVDRNRARFERSEPRLGGATVKSEYGDPPPITRRLSRRKRVQQSDQNTLVSNTRTALGKASDRPYGYAYPAAAPAPAPTGTFLRQPYFEAVAHGDTQHTNGKWQDDGSLLFKDRTGANPVNPSQGVRIPAAERDFLRLGTGTGSGPGQGAAPGLVAVRTGNNHPAPATPVSPGTASPAQATASATASVRPTPRPRFTTPTISTPSTARRSIPTIHTIASTRPPPAAATEPEPESKPLKSFFSALKFKGSKSFLDSCLTVHGDHLIVAQMDKLQVRPADFSSVKAKAVEDARQMQAKVLEECVKAGKDPPKYAILELIGKGSFGRVYKGKDMTSAAIVAVKMIDIDESDTVDPRNADSYSEFLKEVNALKILSENKARNINHVIEALPVGKAMWMITEYCGGGSIATLMKPTSPGGLQEKWIIPILREVAEAIKWVHQAGIIHRDVKCANVLITEQGGVQLCDFGVAGIIEGKLDKRSTVIGTPHWMAPELFDSTPSYGKEVDIWAFGSLVFEIATGLPPNVANGISYDRLGTHLKMHVPRLEGGNYSNELRDLVAYCLEELPTARPTIEQVQKHPYISNTGSRYPASSLSSLVRAFKMWEDHGGNRKSLFMHGGAQGPSELISTSLSDSEWNFSTTAAFDQEFFRQSSAQDVYEAYGTAVIGFSEETSRPQQSQKGSRRRPPPEALARLPAPLEKIFDPNTLSNYEDNSRSHYGRAMPQPTSDLPLRDDSAQISIRDTMIDLGGHDSETGLSSFPDMDTIKAGRHGLDAQSEDDYVSTLPDFSRPALSDPADVNNNRRTQDWKFPSMAPPASADPELSRFPATYEVPRPTVTPGSGSRPALVHHPTEPLGTAFGGSLLGTTESAVERMSIRESLIDLDMGLPDFARPSTSNSDAPSDAGSVTSEPSTTSEHTASMSKDPFELERHASLYQPVLSEQTEPSIYVTEESAVSSSSPRIRTGNSSTDLADMSDFSASDTEGAQNHIKGLSESRYEAVNLSDSDSLSMPPPPLPAQPARRRALPTIYTIEHLPKLPAPPSEAVMTGVSSQNDMKKELKRMLADMTSQLEAFRDVYSSSTIAHKKGPVQSQKKDELASK